MVYTRAVARSSVLVRRLSPPLLAARRSMSAHVWYRGALSSHNNGETSLTSETSLEQAPYTSVAMKQDDTEHLIMVNAPETALGSIALDEIMNPHEFQETMLKWDYMSSFLPTFTSTEQVQMVDAPETALGSIAVNEVMSDDVDSSTTKDHHHQDKELIYNTTSPLDANQNMMVVDQPESALGAVPLSEIMDTATLQAIEQPLQQQDTTSTQVLPRTLQEYYEISGHDDRAMVVTSIKSPHNIVDVNDAWVGLCGYTRGHAVDKSLAELLQGEETKLDPNFLKQLKQGTEASTVVINYDKQGRKFINQVVAGPLVNEHDTVTHFIGVLQEMEVERNVGTNHA